MNVKFHPPARAELREAPDWYEQRSRLTARAFAEERLITFGMSLAGQLLVVSHTECGEAIRIISARVATQPERRIDAEG